MNISICSCLSSLSDIVLDFYGRLTLFIYNASVAYCSKACAYGSESFSATRADPSVKKLVSSLAPVFPTIPELSASISIKES